MVNFYVTGDPKASLYRQMYDKPQSIQKEWATDQHH